MPERNVGTKNSSTAAASEPQRGSAMWMASVSSGPSASGSTGSDVSAAAMRIRLSRVRLGEFCDQRPPAR